MPASSPSPRWAPPPPQAGGGAAAATVDVLLDVRFAETWPAPARVAQSLATLLADAAAGGAAARGGRAAQARRGGGRRGARLAAPRRRHEIGGGGGGVGGVAVVVVVVLAALVVLAGCWRVLLKRPVTVKYSRPKRTSDDDDDELRYEETPASRAVAAEFDSHFGASANDFELETPSSSAAPRLLDLDG